MLAPPRFHSHTHWRILTAGRILDAHPCLGVEGGVTRLQPTATSPLLLSEGGGFHPPIAALPLDWGRARRPSLCYHDHISRMPCLQAQSIPASPIYVDWAVQGLDKPSTASHKHSSQRINIDMSRPSRLASSRAVPPEWLFAPPRVSVGGR